MSDCYWWDAVSVVVMYAVNVKSYNVTNRLSPVCFAGDNRVMRRPDGRYAPVGISGKVISCEDRQHWTGVILAGFWAHMSLGLRRYAWTGWRLPDGSADVLARRWKKI